MPPRLIMHARIDSPTSGPDRRWRHTHGRPAITTTNHSVHAGRAHAAFTILFVNPSNEAASSTDAAAELYVIHIHVSLLLSPADTA